MQYSQDTIYASSYACQARFRECLEYPALSQNGWARKHLADFNLWTSGSGALAQQRASLDQRLVSEKSTQTVIINILGLLESLIKTCQESAKTLEENQLVFSNPEVWVPPPRLSQALADIDTIFQQLVRISIAIRQSSTQARIDRADLLFVPSRHVELRNHLTLLCLVSSLVSREEWRSQINENGHGSTFVPDEIQSRLIEANLRRRHRFLYAERRWVKQAEEREAESERQRDHGSRKSHQENGDAASYHKSSLSQTRQTENRPAIQQSSTHHDEGEQLARTETSTVPTAIDTPVMIPPQGAPSMTIISETGLKIGYPRAPKAIDGQQYFLCPCCFQTLPLGYSQGRKWKKHLAEDICPYVCILSDCERPYQLYASRKDWESHMQTEHESSKSWQCFACVEPTKFSNETDFIAHLETQHKDTVMQDQITFFVSECLCKSSPAVSSCPLCPKSRTCGEKKDDPRILMSHIATHIHEFALSSLPWLVPGIQEQQYLGVSDAEKKFEYFAVSAGTNHSDDSESAPSAASESWPGDFDLEGLPEPVFEEEMENNPPSILVSSDLESPSTTQQDEPDNSTLAAQEFGWNGWNEGCLDSLVYDQREHLGKFLRKHSILIDHPPYRFWSDTFLERLLTRERLVTELTMKPLYYKKERAEELVDRILGTSKPSQGRYFKIMAVLLLIYETELIHTFIDEGFSDEHLPMHHNYRTMVSERRNGDRRVKCLTGVDISVRERFFADQWTVMTPYFKFNRERKSVEDFPDPTILPWKLYVRNTAQGICTPVLEGGYGLVQGVKIHHTSHDFTQVWKDMGLQNKAIAVKAMRPLEQFAPNATMETRKIFENEKDQLERFSNYDHPHLIVLLSAFVLKGIHHFCFPFAECDLMDYWEQPRPAWTKDTLLWVSKQFKGLLGAVCTIHDPEHLNKQQLHPNEEKRYGRHGDIKPDNILLFQSANDNGGTLVLSDMGLPSFNRDKSRSNIPAQGVPTAPGYRPPECDIAGGTISRAFDVWTLGCLFLEFLAWLLGGKEYLVDFENARMTDLGGPGALKPLFFQFKKYEAGDRMSPSGISEPECYTVKVNEGVSQWIAKLHGHEYCSKFVHEVLDIIENHMLVVLSEDSKRLPSSELLTKFNAIHAHSERDDDYLIGKDGHKRRPEMGKEVMVVPTRAALKAVSQLAGRELSQRPRHLSKSLTEKDYRRMEFVEAA